MKFPFRFRLRPTPKTRFDRDERGSMSIETVLTLPLMILMFIIGYQYFDAYRREVAITKASYAVADLLSRRQDLVTPFDLEGLTTVFETLTFSTDERTYMRFSEVRREAGGGLKVIWSYATDEQLALNDLRVQAYLSKIPRLAVNERILLVESFTYDSPRFGTTFNQLIQSRSETDAAGNPRFTVGLEDRIISNIVPISARYDARIAFAPEGEEGDDVTVNNTDCDDEIVPVDGEELVGAGNCTD
ncbi:TadE/TadG family type IV pilus assembly protein [Jannaschia pohangensis]|uniref:TadE-like protein n=1 Tax=Jannaschia pohangensis TaxID=390807 RepID=A0A1I3LPY7_9RHOB|nr:hypothetical protein [Jannaschia pohangensis]SFI86610.1 hypothetical protein SAMN04488095_1594 [Jannaschia pohangensis]